MQAIGYNPVFGEFDQNGWCVIEPKRHVVVVGKTGTGKSTYLVNSIIDRIAEEDGVLVIDPHGPVVEEVLDRIPTNRVEDVIYFDPLSDRAIGLNPFAHSERDRAKDIVKTLVKTTWPEGWGPQTEDILSYAIDALYEFWPCPSMAFIQKFLMNTAFRKRLCAKLKDPYVKQYFYVYDHEWDKRMRTEKSAPVINKVNKFVNDRILRRIFGQPDALDFRKAIDDRKILLFNLSKEKIGSDRSAFIGGVVAFKHQMALISRQNVPARKRPPSYAFIDEFLSYLGADISVYVGEARKYGGFLTLATQTIAPVPEMTKQVLLGNVGTFVIFRTGAEDAELFAREFGKEFPASAFLTLKDYECWVNTVREGIPIKPTLVRAFPPQKKTPYHAKKESVIRRSRDNFGRKVSVA